MSTAYTLFTVLLIGFGVIGWTFTPMATWGEIMFGLLMATMLTAILSSKKDARGRSRSWGRCNVCLGNGSRFKPTGYDENVGQVIGYMVRCEYCNGSGRAGGASKDEVPQAERVDS